MTVSAVNSYSGPLYGNGSTTDFPFTFHVMSEDEVKVTVDGALQTGTYTVAFSDDSNGGTVTFAAAPADGTEVLIYSVPTFAQNTSFQNAGQFLASSHDDALDRAAVRDIYLKDRSDRSIRAPLGEPMDELPIAADRAGRFLSFDADGQPTVASGTDGGDGLRTDLAAVGGAALVGFQNSGSSLASRSVQARLRDTVSVRDKSITGTDIAPAINAIIADIGGSKGDLGFGEFYIPTGDWTLGETALSNHQSLQIEGIGRPRITWAGAAGGTMIQIQDSSAVRLENMILLGGGLIPDKAIYYDDTGAAGTPQDSGGNELLEISRFLIGRRWGQNAEVYTGVNNGFVSGIYIGGPNLVNNDSFYIAHGEIADCSSAGLQIASNQSIWSSIESVIFDTCGYGIDTRSVIQGRNLCFNRNTIADLRIRDDMGVHDIVGFNSENAKLLIEASNNASIRISGGKCILSATTMTGDYWATFTIAKHIHFEDWLVDAGTTTGKRLYVRASFKQRSHILIERCDLPDGDSRDAYDFNVEGGDCGIDFDIATQQGFRAVGRLDGTRIVDFGSIVDGGTNGQTRTIAAASGISAGAPVLASAGAALSGMILTGNAASATSLYVRLNNESGAAVDLPEAKFRWRKIVDAEMKARGSATYDMPSTADGAGVTTTVSVPCALGDFVYWGATVSYSALMVSAYVSAANTVSIRIQNESGAVSDPASATLYAYVLKDSAFDFIGAAIDDPPSIADGATHSINVTIPGARVGDFALASFSVDLQGISHGVEISADDTARVMLYNETGGAIDLASMTVKVGAFIALG